MNGIIKRLISLALIYSSRQSLIVGNNAEEVEYKVVAISADGDFMMVYIFYGRKTSVSFAKLKATRLRDCWFNPRDKK